MHEIEFKKGIRAMERLLRFIRDEGGTEAVEWGVISALLVLAAAAFWSELGGLVTDTIGSLVAALS